MFIKEGGDWTRFLKLPGLAGMDFHDGRRDRSKPYWELMDEFHARALQAVQDAAATGKQYVLFTHGSSTSRAGQTTARSVVRGLMRSKAATKYIVRSKCIQHESVFVAAIRPPAARDC